MILKIFLYAQYFSKSSAMCLDIKVLHMGGCPYDLVLIGVRVVGRFVMRGSRLSLFGFGNRFFTKRKVIVKRSSLSRVNFTALMISYF